MNGDSVLDCAARGAMRQAAEGSRAIALSVIGTPRHIVTRDCALLSRVFALLLETAAAERAVLIDMAPHYLRVARALAFVSTAVVVAGCGGKTEGGVTPGDAASDSNGGDTSSNPDTTPPPLAGKCRYDGTKDLTCEAGGLCIMTMSETTPRCLPPGVDAGSGMETVCGTILCAQNCWCGDPTNNMCTCARAVTGPLPPPELATRRARRSSPHRRRGSRRTPTSRGTSAHRCR